MNNSAQPRETINADLGLRSFLTRMYGWMALSVLVSAITGFLISTVYRAQLLSVMQGSRGMLWLPIIAWAIVPFFISSQSLKRPTGALIGLLLYAAFSGAVFATYTLSYGPKTILAAFGSAASVFIVMAFFGTVTKRDLTKIGTQAQAALWGLIIAFVINIFLQSPVIAYVFSFIAVIIFTILTAWDAQNMKNLYLKYEGQVSTNGLAVNGALTLYLDFVNLFLQFLQIFGLGGSRD